MSMTHLYIGFVRWEIVTKEYEEHYEIYCNNGFKPWIFREWLKDSTLDLLEDIRWLNEFYHKGIITTYNDVEFTVSIYCDEINIDKLKKNMPRFRFEKDMRNFYA